MRQRIVPFLVSIIRTILRPITQAILCPVSRTFFVQPFVLFFVQPFRLSLSIKLCASLLPSLRLIYKTVHSVVPLSPLYLLQSFCNSVMLFEKSK